MFPSFDTFGLQDLEARHQLLSTIGWWVSAISAFAALFLALWWQVYLDRISSRIAVLKEERDEANARARRALNSLLMPEC